MADNQPLSPKAKAAKTISIIIFVCVFVALLIAFIVDLVAFGEVILAFIVGLFLSAIVFVLANMLMVISIILIFGFYILTENGYWPATWAMNTFHEVVADAQISEQQVMIFNNTRIFLLVVCIILFILAIVTLSLLKSNKKERPEEKAKPTKGFAVTTLVLSILGILMQIASLAIMALVSA